MRFSRKVFYTKIGWPIWLPLLLTISLTLLAGYFNLPALLRSAIYIAMAEVFMIGLILQTAYKVRANNTLYVTGVFIDDSVFLIADIDRIVRLKNKRIAPGFAKNSLAIHCASGQVFLISPERPDEFVAALLKINPAIRTLD